MTTEHDGLASRESWAASPVHQASRYSCGKCGKTFPDPHALYEHLDNDHPKKSDDGK
jgi:hypothetical protein